MNRIVHGVVVASLAFVMASCGVGGGGGSESSASPASEQARTTEPVETTTTTEDPAPLIRQYASAVAEARTGLVVRGCDVASTCALNVATAWLGLTQEFERLSKRSDPPAEIERLVNEVVDSGSLMGPVFIPSLRECLDGQSMEDPIAYLSACEFEAKMVIGEGERLAKSLAAWEPYL